MGKPGRKPVVDHSELKTLLAENKNRIVVNGTISTPAENSVWDEIGQKLSVKGSTVYSYSVGDRYGYRTMLVGANPNSSLDSSARSMDNSTNDESSKFNYEGDYEFRIPKTTFTQLVQEKVVKSGGKRTRVRTILKPNEWEETIQASLWNTHKIPHGFNFDTHNLRRNADSGKIKGHCSCGGTIEITIDNEHNEFNTIFECHIIRGLNTNCKPRQLRSDKRKQISEQLENQSVDAYVTEERRKLQDHGDPNPPLLYKENVLRTAKYEHTISQYRDKDPVTAIKMLKNSSVGKDVIHDIGSWPFYVVMFSTHQMRLYNHYSNKYPLIMDSTSGIARKLEILDGVKSHSLFLHLGVIRCDKGQFAVFSSISERQDTVTLEISLKRFFQRGANIPKQVITDEGRGIQTCVISACTAYKNVEGYSDAFFEDPKMMEDVTLVSTDVNHYMKGWSDYLKTIKVQGPIKTFYMASIGQLVLSNTLDEAKKLIELIFIVCLSTYDGALKNEGVELYLRTQKTFSKEELSSIKQRREPTLTDAELANRKLHLLITGQEEIYQNVLEENVSLECDSFSGNESSDSSDSDDESIINDNEKLTKRRKNQSAKVNKYRKKISQWEEWALSIKENIEKCISKQRGTHLNAHKNDEICNRLVRAIRHLPMWSNIYNKKFSSTNVKPATSASVECEVKNVLYSALNGKGKTYRVDRTVEKIVKFYDGKLRSVGNLDCEDDANNGDGTNVNQCDVNLASNVESSSHSHTTCPACSNGDVPGGAHQCDICLRNVHALSACSKPLSGDCSDEGYGQKRICNACSRQDNLNVAQGIDDNNIPQNVLMENSPSIDSADNFDNPPELLRNILNLTTKCIACLNGDAPQGAHKCHICLTKVHALPECSKPLSSDSDDEGYGTLRICIPCSEKADVDQHVAMNEIENHKGLALKDLTNTPRPKKRKSDLYLGGSKKKISDALRFGKENSRSMKTIPIMKAGSHKGLAFVQIKNTKISLKYTCPFDCLYQIHMVMCSDYLYFKQNLLAELKSKELSDSSSHPVENESAKISSRQIFIEMLISTLNNGQLTAAEYRKRTTIMLDFKNIQLPEEESQLCIDCSCDFGILIQKIYQDRPSITIVKRCPGECRDIEVALDSVPTDISYLHSQKLLENYLENYFNRREECETAGCKEVLNNTVILKPVLRIETYALSVAKLKMGLSKIPKRIRVMNKFYLLTGFIDYEGDETDREDLGHYTAICFRNNNWIEYDDRLDKPEPKKASAKVKPKYLFYLMEQ